MTIEFEQHPYRTPLKFGNAIVNHCTLMNAKVRVQTRSGDEAVGFGSMTMGNVWSFPTRLISAEKSLDAMVRLAPRIADIAREATDYAHPLDHDRNLEPAYLDAATSLSREMALESPIPELCTHVVASPIDAAIHDAFGKANRINSYAGLGRNHTSSDLSRYLNDDFKHRYIDECVTRDPKPTMPIYHLVGALDPLTALDVSQHLNDGLPETLAEWIRTEHLTRLKIKLTGDDIDWDVHRVLNVDKVASEALNGPGSGRWTYSVDFNERCSAVDYVLEFLARIREARGHAFSRLAYIEQPTDRVLSTSPEQKMHQAAAIKPIVIDESLVDFESLLQAREQGYSGVALKTCKGHSKALLMAAAAHNFGLFTAVQDLTCPGASFLHSLGLAARIKGVAAIEGNARQFCPAANREWAHRHPNSFTVVDGAVAASNLTRIGLGH